MLPSTFIGIAITVLYFIRAGTGSLRYLLMLEFLVLLILLAILLAMMEVDSADGTTLFLVFISLAACESAVGLGLITISKA